ncbi:MAG: cytochrome c oxidase assembly protein [Hyphomonadaceae bacterium]|nr:cytochrome c oxidase assembly protein [Hyphomonadaceae bacterium]MBC6411452.1 cytochrome c oxidase assembly protein [Hyphomonadaceae bacterium]
MSANRKTVIILIGAALVMLGLGFASKPLYDTFCRVTGFGGTPKIAEANNSEVIDRTVRVYFDANTAPDLPWKFEPEQRYMDIQLGRSGLAYYNVKNDSPVSLVGTATFNVTPIKAAPYFIKTECFCFQEQRVEPGQEISMPVLFFVEPLMNGEARLDDVREITLSYTFFRVENPIQDTHAAQGRDALN